MMTFTDLRYENTRLMVIGYLNFETVNALRQKSLVLMKNKKALHFDFSLVKYANSAGVALMLEWANMAKKNKQTLVFSAVPQSLVAMISLSGLTDLLVT